ncbi:MAG: hypothetical protein QXK98_04070 [Candidatus Bathyarchaeia archaeon]
MLEAALKYVKENGGKIVEGYPIEPKKGRYRAHLPTQAWLPLFERRDSWRLCDAQKIAQSCDT